MDGVQTAENIWNSSKFQWYILLNIPMNTVERAKITGSFGYILKPFEEKTYVINER